MDPSLILPYLWVLLVLVFLEGLLAADNAIVMAVMVKHLPPEQRKKALFYGLLGAFIFRFIALFLISIIANFWWIQAAGAIYLIYMSIKNLWDFFHKSEEEHHKDSGDDHHYDDSGDDHHYDDSGNEKKVGPKAFWGTVFKVEFADIAFAIDSMLAALAIAVTLPKMGIHFGGMDLGQFIVMFLGGMIGVILMRFAANWFVELLNKYPGLEGAAFAIVGWVGIKLVVMVLAHPDIGVLPEEFPHGALWQSIFWAVLILLVIIGWFTSVIKNKKKNK
ncbi:TerC family protein [Staphylococcus capitis]|uniref:TerC family protein n=2 Tax=Staphylococcus TaxID=1279 RepID=UPI001D13DE66|nr:TerC family protein [Staphylococcus capitis]MCC3744420.1 TerC family protein [Staphylococcus capitis]